MNLQLNYLPTLQFALYILYYYNKQYTIVLVQRVFTTKREPCPSGKVTERRQNWNPQDLIEGRGDRQTMPRTFTGHTRVWTERLSKSSFPSQWTQNTIADRLFCTSDKCMRVENFVIHLSEEACHIQSFRSFTLTSE